MEEEIITKWENGEEWMSKPSWRAWIRTGNHRHSFIEDNSLGKDNRGRCIICGKED